MNAGPVACGGRFVPRFVPRFRSRYFLPQGHGQMHARCAREPLAAARTYAMQFFNESFDGVLTLELLVQGLDECPRIAVDEEHAKGDRFGR